MPEGMTQTEVAAFEMSSRAFDMLVDEVLDGKPIDVVVTWVDSTVVEGSEDGAQRPVVTIDGQSVFDFVRIPMEYSASNTPELIALTAKGLEEKLGAMWEDTLGYYKELSELDTALTGLVMSREAGYFDRAEVALREQGTDGLGDGEIVAAARQLATQELLDWAEAVEV